MKGRDAPYYYKGKSYKKSDNYTLSMKIFYINQQKSWNLWKQRDQDFFNDKFT